ncbi:hypothetical protein K8I61_08695 [bacterium]|nr:hypothetical protein [bacterium]
MAVAGAAIALALIFAAPGARAKVVTVDKILCEIGNDIITMQQVRQEGSILRRAHDSLLFPGQEDSLNDRQVFLELVVRRLLMNTAVKMGLSTITTEEVDNMTVPFRALFGGAGDYVVFLNEMELKDGTLPDDADQTAEYGIDINYRFRNVFVVKRFVDKKLDLQVRLAMDQQRMENAGPEAAAPAGGETASEALSPEDKTRRQELYLKLLKEWVRDIASRERITVLDRRYRAVLIDYLGFDPIREGAVTEAES